MAPDARAPSYEEFKESYERARKFIRLFDPLENIINMGFSRIRGMFRFRYLDLKYTLSFLEIIYLRYVEELECYKKYVDSLKASGPDIELMGNVMHYEELVNLDYQSFLIYARILFDRLVYMLEPLFEEVITKKGHSPKIRSFNAHIKWFNDDNNLKYIIDNDYVELLNSICDFFYDDLKNPRDDLIIHPKGRITIPSIKDGNIFLIDYRREMITDNIEQWIQEPTELPEIEGIYEQILRFLNEVNDFFCNILS